MDKQEKIKLLEKLVNDKIITFSEALNLMETEKEYIYTGYIPTNQTYQPYQPYLPYGYNKEVYCGTTLTTA
jgi:hypothetical protein